MGQKGAEKIEVVAILPNGMVHVLERCSATARGLIRAARIAQEARFKLRIEDGWVRIRMNMNGETPSIIADKSWIDPIEEDLLHPYDRRHFTGLKKLSPLEAAREILSRRKMLRED